MIKETARVTVLAPYIEYNGDVLERDQSVDFSDKKIFATPDESVSIEGKPCMVMIDKPKTLHVRAYSNRLGLSQAKDLQPVSSHPEHRVTTSNPPGVPEFSKTIWPIYIGEDPLLPPSEVLGVNEPCLQVCYLGHPLRNAIDKLITGGRSSVILREFVDKNERKTVYRDILFEPVYLNIESAETIFFLELMVIENEGKTGKIKSRAPTLFRLSLANRLHSDGLVRVNQPPWHTLDNLNKEERKIFFERTAEVLQLSKKFDTHSAMTMSDMVFFNEYMRQGYDFKETDNLIKLPIDGFDESEATLLAAKIYDFVKSI